VFIDTVPADAARGGLAEFYEQQRAVWGFVPGYVHAFSTRPEVAHAWTGRDGSSGGSYSSGTMEQ